MKLTASLIVRNELDRYLKECVSGLQEFCDEIRVVDDASKDGTGEWLTYNAGSQVTCTVSPESVFYEHEGNARQHLLDFTLQGDPSHILAVDADEFVTDGRAVREAVSGDGQAWSLLMGEVWKADEQSLWVRVDGGWRPHPVPILFRTNTADRNFRISPKQLACGREPLSIRYLAVRGRAPTVGTILHFGWACEADRRARYERYVVADGGRFHASTHLESIMWSDSRVHLEQWEWPDWDENRKQRLLARANRDSASL